MVLLFRLGLHLLTEFLKTDFISKVFILFWNFYYFYGSYDSPYHYIIKMIDISQTVAVKLS